MINHRSRQQVPFPLPPSPDCSWPESAVLRHVVCGELKSFCCASSGAERGGSRVQNSPWPRQRRSWLAESAVAIEPLQRPSVVRSQNSLNFQSVCLIEPAMTASLPPLMIVSSTPGPQPLPIGDGDVDHKAKNCIGSGPHQTKPRSCSPSSA